MNITGVITEYNPFHNGHLYHLNESRRMTGADHIIAVMSGDFLQRGTPAIIHKYARTRMALLCGADLVLELPSRFACSSAEYFASGGIDLLNRLGCVTDFVFGSECSDSVLLSKAASVLLEEPPLYRQILNEELRLGASFPVARQTALQAVMPELSGDLLNSPNNILGFEYLKALMRLKSNIIPHCLKRQGSGYHDVIDSDQPFASATGIRKTVFENISCDRSEFPEAVLSYYVPEEVLDILKEAFGSSFPVSEQDFDALLRYRLLTVMGHYTDYMDVPEDLAARIEKSLPEYENFSSFIQKLKTKNYTYTRISRALIHILLDMKVSPQKESFKYMVPYARILGFRKNSSTLLHELKLHSSIPLITKMADGDKVLAAHHAEAEYALSYARSLLKQDVLAADIYETASADKFRTKPRNEYTQGIVII